MKQTKHILLMAAMLLCSLAASAQTKVEIDGIWYNLVPKAKQAEVTFKGDSYDSYYDEYTGSITLPATVTYDGVAYSVTSIGDDAFRYCSSLTDITIPEGVTSIGDYAFHNCFSLTDITIPESVTSIGVHAFSFCSSLTDITIPESVTSIGDYAIVGCSSLTAITLPEGMTSIGNLAFSGCSSLTAITIPEGVTSIGSRAFEGCSSLKSITLPEGVTSIGGYAFYGCSSLTAITIPEGVTSIENHAFYGCSSLTTIVLPKKLNTIYSEAFANCSELLDVYCYAESAPEANSNAFEGSYPEYATLHVPENALDSYQATAPWSSFGSIQAFITGTCGDNLTWALTNKGELIIEGAGAMHEYYEVYPWSEHTESIQTISIKEGVTSIGAWAFSNCSNLTSITIPESVTSIGDAAFDDCSNLTSIFIPKGVSSIGLWAFVSCSSLNSIIVAENNTTYDSREGCNAIIETSSDKLILGCAATVIPENVTTIGNAAFCECTSLTNITIPENVGSIEEGAFVDCTSLNTVVMLSKNLSSIGAEAFAYCDKLSDIYCHSTSVPSTENDAFYKSSPENITLHVPTNAIDDYKSTEPWSSFGTIVAIVEPTLGKCSTPTISYVDGQIMLACETEEVEFITNVVTENELTYEEATFDFVPTYTFNAYATKDKYEDSDVATITLCWIPCTENHDTNNVITIPAKPVLIQSHEGIVTISGLAEGVEIAVYNTAGYKVASSIADNGTAIIDTNLTAGSVAIVEIGGKGIKIVVK